MTTTGSTPPAASVPALPLAPSSARRPKFVLLVEDAPEVRETAQQALEVLGYAVVGVGSAEEALAELDRGALPDLLITDISLPGKSGLELAMQCVQKHPAVKVIFASGYGEVSEHLGVKGWSLPKPYGVQDLQQVLAAAQGADKGC